MHGDVRDCGLEDAWRVVLSGAAMHRQDVSCSLLRGCDAPIASKLRTLG
jgi:hypothetical protein